MNWQVFLPLVMCLPLVAWWFARRKPRRTPLQIFTFYFVYAVLGPSLVFFFMITDWLQWFFLALWLGCSLFGYLNARKETDAITIEAAPENKIGSTPGWVRGLA